MQASVHWNIETPHVDPYSFLLSYSILYTNPKNVQRAWTDAQLYYELSFS